MDFYKKTLFALTCVYIILLPLIPKEFIFHGVLFTDLILALMIFVYIIGIIVSKKGRENFINGIVNFFLDKLSIFMTILLAIMLLSTIYAVDKTLALSESARFITYIFMYFIIKYEFNNKKQIKILLRCYIFVSFVLSCIGIVQHFTGFGLTEKFTKPSAFGTGIRIASTLFNPNAYGAYLILIIFPVIMLSIYEKNKNKKIMYIFLSILLLTNLLMTLSRNAFLGFGLGVLVLALIYSIKLIFALGGFSILMFFIPSVFQRVKDVTNLSQDESRIKLWKTAIMMIKEHPLLGVGNGNYVTRYNEYIKKYKELKYQEYKNYPGHNSYLKVQSELGLIGIASFLGIVTITLCRVKKLYSITTDNFYKPFYMGVMAAMVAFLFMNLFDNLFFVPKATTYFWFLLATVEALLNNRPKGIYEGSTI
ncbi:O-antigen ligase family protein [Clostridium bowmanii]|uniref:O-antigen ligase family protein n=1 Tax=Clostridium bowmanii TaxID=132925 RepID=UPI001C0E88F5|nr:O-antigen ligase family protein [Clostridium bowmanii]MBU3190963.1 O-antigen ligase family protein [Clostridium bowmanii]MCA1075418.1 O-antigen ligase family protein [Clostridium bowmanii]